MTAPTRAPSGRDTAEIDLGHPVRSFVVLLLVVALVLVALAATGAVHPHLSSSASQDSSFLDRRIVGTEVHNEALLPVRVDGADWTVRGADVVEIGVAPPGYGEGTVPLNLADLPPWRPFTLEPNESRWVFISVVPRCLATVGDLRLDVRAPVGLHRTVGLDVREIDLGGAC